MASVGFTYDGGNVSITNNASVTGTTAAIDASATGGGTVSINNYGTINGAVVSDATTTFQNEAGAIWNASSSSTFTGPSFTNQGTINVTNGAALTISATSYTDTGTLTANGGNITVTGAETGAGSATIYGTSQIQYDGPSSENVTFATGATGELVLLDSAAFTGTITGFTGTGAGPTTSDKLDLGDINFSSPLFSKSYANNVLTVSDGTHTANINFVGTYTHRKFLLRIGWLQRNLGDRSTCCGWTERCDGLRRPMFRVRLPLAMARCSNSAHRQLTRSPLLIVSARLCSISPRASRVRLPEFLGSATSSI